MIVKIFTFISFLQLLLFCFILCSSEQTDLDGLEEFKVFYSLNYTFNELRKYSDSAYVRNLIDTFVAHCPINPIDFHPVKKHLFIVIDSSHRRTRSIIGRQLARRIGGKLIYNPPRYMVRSKLSFNYTITMKRAFFALGVYGASYKAKKLVSESPVIVNGYFMDQINFGIHKKYKEPPPMNSSIYSWPNELLKPDINFFISTPTLSGITNASIASDIRTKRITKLYHCWKEPRTIEIKNATAYRDIIALIIQNLNKEMNTSFPIMTRKPAPL